MLLLATCLAVMLAAPKDQEIAFKTPDGVELHGSFLEPSHAAGSKVKAILLLPGSGPTDRNGNQPPALVTDLLKQIAEALAQKGIASFRFDKRAAHVNSAIWPKDMAKLDDFFAFERFTGDAEAALDTLKKQPGVDSSHVGMMGHSEGGLITIVLANKLGKDKLSAIGLLSTAGRGLDLVLKQQIRDLLAVQTTDESVIKMYMDKLSEGIEHVKSTGTLPTNMPVGLQPLFGPGTAKILRSYFTIDPAATIQSYKGNVILVQGEMDSQVSLTNDFPLLKKALSSRTDGTLTAVTVPNASHNLKRVEKLRDPGVDGPVDAGAISKLVSWAAANL